MICSDVVYCWLIGKRGSWFLVPMDAPGCRLHGRLRPTFGLQRLSVCPARDHEHVCLSQIYWQWNRGMRREQVPMATPSAHQPRLAERMEQGVRSQGPSHPHGVHSQVMDDQRKKVVSRKEEGSVREVCVWMEVVFVSVALRRAVVDEYG